MKLQSRETMRTNKTKLNKNMRRKGGFQDRTREKARAALGKGGKFLWKSLILQEPSGLNLNTDT